MNKIIYCQFSNKLLNPWSNGIDYKYYHAIYRERKADGYYKSNNFFELPLWIAEISGSLNGKLKEELYIIDNIESAIEKLNHEKDCYICFSVLDITKHHVLTILSRYTGNGKVCIGGYIDFSYFDGLMESIQARIIKFQTIKGFIEYLGIGYFYNLSYELFKGYKTIPRLTLSKGCLNRCKFCIVEKIITQLSEFDILKQIESFKPLRFKLVYLNDKTFGQSKNYGILYDLYFLIKEYNPDFQGFIIQTTVIQTLSLKEMLLSGIIYAVEIGVETFNDDILYSLCKPQTEKNIIQAMELLKDCNVKIIPNIIIGLIGENKDTYNRTLKLISDYQDSIYLLNIYNLAIYQDSQLSKEITISDDNDLNENSTDKTFYSPQQKIDNEYFYNTIFKIGLKILGYNN